jgi:hypothetical protein
VLILNFASQSFQSPRHVQQDFALDAGQQKPLLKLRVTIFTHPAVDAPITREVMLTPERCVLLT